MSNIPDAKNRILDAAILIFAEKAFDGSRINDIAERANVPKSLIYYHFKNKEDILATLISNFINEYGELSQIAKKDTHEEKTIRMADRLQNHYADFAFKNKDLIRIILVESLKKNNEKPGVFKIVEDMVANEGDNIRNTPGYDVNERLVAEFYTGLAPLFLYLCLHEKWCGYFDISKNELDRLFLRHIEETHGAYHKNHTLKDGGING